MRKPRLSDNAPSPLDYTVESMLTKKNGIGQEALSPPDQASVTKSHKKPHPDSSNSPFPSTTVATSMAFSYPSFNGQTDAVSHIRSLLNIWNANHMAQKLPKAEAHASKIAEFGLTLDGRAAPWHSQLDITSFASFDQLQSSFL